MNNLRAFPFDEVKAALAARKPGTWIASPTGGDSVIVAMDDPAIRPEWLESEKAYAASMQARYGAPYIPGQHYGGDVIGESIAQRDQALIAGAPAWLEIAVATLGEIHRLAVDVLGGNYPTDRDRVAWFSEYLAHIEDLAGGTPPKPCRPPVCKLIATPTDEDGIHSGRRRYRAACSVHGLIHEATTGAIEQFEYHLRIASGGAEAAVSK